MAALRFNLERWQAEMAANRSRIEALVLAHPCDKTPETGWNISQCLQHLDITAHAFIKEWSNVLALKLRKPGSNYAFWWRWFLRNIENTSKLRSKTPPKFDPETSSKLEEALNSYLQTRENIAQFATAMQDAQTGGTPIHSPFASWMKYPLDFSFDLVAAHERRHLTQAETI